MTSVTLTWHTMGDDKVCEVCKELGKSGRWVFELGTSTFPNELIHPQFGIVWNVTLGSAAHSKTKIKHTCRCWITSEWEFGDLLEKVRSLHAMVLEMYEKQQEAKTI